LNKIYKKDFLSQKNILIKNLNTKNKSVPFKPQYNSVGDIKYFPADSKEWNNKIYFFNYNYMQNLFIYDMNIYKLIKNYFSMYFKKNLVFKRALAPKRKDLSLNKVYISKPEIKHTNSKAVITIYVYNRENISILKNIKKRKLIKLLNIIKRVINKLERIFINSKIFSNKNTFLKNLFFLKNIFKLKIIKKLNYIRKTKFKLNLNEYKFKDIFLAKLSTLIIKFYNKKIEFNIINLKSIRLNPDIFTEYLRLKLRKKRRNVLRRMNFIINNVKLPDVDIALERARITKSINYDLLENQYKNMNLNLILNENNLDKTLKNFYEKTKKNLILNLIKYKNIGGIKLEIKGRLTKRYRADRAIYKVKWKGGLRNIDSCYKGLSTVNFRGYSNSGMEYSIKQGKRRIGAFAVKGWISGK
jgi:hypothetical protein